MIALSETVRPISDRSEPNNSFSIDEIDLARDLGIGKVLESDEMDDGADFKRHGKC
jgi:hypothetical protein